MSLLRLDVTTKDWVIFEPQRARRPHALKRVGGLSTAALPPTSCHGTT
jgi:hypothetical protein